MSSLENLWPDPSVNKEIRRGGFGLLAGCQVAGSGGAHLRKFQRASVAASPRLRPSRVGRLQPENAPAEWGGYNERKRDRHALGCSHVTLLPCSSLRRGAPHLRGFAARTPQQSGAATTRKRPSRVGRLQRAQAGSARLAL